MSKIDLHEIDDGVDRIRYITTTLGIYPRDFLSDQEQLISGGTPHVKEGDTSDSWYIPFALRMKKFRVDQIKEIREFVRFMPSDIIAGGLGVSLESGQKFGFGLSELDEKGLTRRDPQLVVATVDHRTGEFVSVRNETQRYINYTSERGISLHMRPVGWQPEWARRKRSAERG